MRLFEKMRKFSGFIAGFAIAGTVFLFIQAKTVDSYFEISKNLEIFASLFKALNANYVDGIEPGRLVKTGINAMLDELDPYTNYITESDIEDYQFMTTGKYGGIGANMRKKGDEIYVGDVYENSPAQKAGLHPGDLVISIDNTLIKGKSIDDISLLLKGAPGTQVVIKVKDAYSEQVSQKQITRGEIEISSVPYAGFVGVQGNVGYVRLTQFTPNCTRFVREALDSLRQVKPGMKSLILDLRNNPGGLLDEAVNMCNLFLDRGQLVVSTKGKVEEGDRDYKTQSKAWDMSIPLAVLVNHSSASASEIVAGTVQDVDRGIVLGERSYGKGLVQTTVPLGYNTRLKLTIAKYYTPSGRCIQALDYSHRNDDGSVGYVPDSLKKSYRTKAGRIVKSGGGVEPDVHVDQERVSLLAVTLYSKNYFFDYATEYAQKHPSIAPASNFSLTDAEVDQFFKWLDGKDYAYKTETDILLDSLKNVAVREKYFDGARSEFTALQTKVSHDKKQDLVKHKEELKHILEGEIVSRYYYMRGRIAQSLPYDDEVQKAISLLDNTTQYQALLRPSVKP